MERNLKNQKEVQLGEQKVPVWKVKFGEPQNTLQGLLLCSNEFFVPVNGGDTSNPEFSHIAKFNCAIAGSIDTPVRALFTKMGVLYSGRRQGVITFPQPVDGITGIMFELALESVNAEETDIINQISLAYPNLTIEPEILG